VVKVPRVPRHPLTVRADEVVEFGGPLWRIHRTAGPHAIPWNALRRFGPLTSMRFDPHPVGAGPEEHPRIGVHYNAIDIVTAVAETFQRTRLVDPYSYRPTLTGWTPGRPLRLLDLAGPWALRNGAAQSLAAAPRSVCRNWAREIETQLTDLDGLLAPSTMTGSANVVLWQRGADGIPSAPQFSRPLDHPDVRRLLRSACVAIGYRLI